MAGDAVSARTPRARAYAATREVCGEEVCRAIDEAVALWAVATTGAHLNPAEDALVRDAQTKLLVYRQTAHQLRAQVVALLLLRDDPSRCPNCQGATTPERPGPHPYHCNDGCHLKLLLEAYDG
jgi:hypothetical protein